MPLKYALRSSGIVLRPPSAFVCQICRFHRSGSVVLGNTIPPSRSYRSQHVGRRRLLSTASATAINAKKEIPPPFQELHATLSTFKDAASTYANPDQLQLALRGLESKNSVTRVAVFGANGQHGARRLVWALLADPLCPRSEWETQLLDDADHDGRSLLLRYGEQLDIDQRHPLIKTLSIPASSLRTHNLEILIQAIPDISGISATESKAEVYLVPSLELNSPTGRIRSGTFPVHRSIIYAEGLQDISILPPKSSIQMIKGVIDASWNNLQEGFVSDQVSNPINLGLAESAINSIRQSSEHGLKYEHGWFDSGLAGVSAWLFAGSDGTAGGGGLKPGFRQLVETLCDNAERAIAQQEAAESQHQAKMAIPIVTRDSFNQDIALWAEFAHTELRNQLDIWFSNRSWKKMAWWHLFWRVDDISSITSDVLQRAWLVEAEKGMIWLFARLEQAGLIDPETRIRRPAAKVELPQIRTGAFPGLPLIPGLVPEPATDRRPDVPRIEPIPRPWPQGVSRARNSLSVTTVRPLQALAQRLLLEAVSTTVLTSSLSALVYISLSSPSLYEAGTIAALGFVYSLHRLQGRWGLAKDTWEKSVREEGVRVLRDIETDMRTMVKEGGKPIVDEKAEEERGLAKNSIEKVRTALDGVTIG